MPCLTVCEQWAPGLPRDWLVSYHKAVIKGELVSYHKETKTNLVSYHKEVMKELLGLAGSQLSLAGRGEGRGRIAADAGPEEVIT